MKPLVGVWYGEFGWELACWQGYLRKLSKTRPVHVICPDGHESLYSDFALHVQPHDLNGDRDCWRIRGCDAKLCTLINNVKQYADSINGESLYAKGVVDNKDQTFIRFGLSTNINKEDRFDILLHARCRSVRGSNRNTELEQAIDLVRNLSEFRIASIGSKTEAAHVYETVDLRGIPLNQLTDHMSAAGAVVGPASGPSVLALLCGTPGVVWSDTKWYSSIKAGNKERLERLWNPFHTPVTVMDADGFNPSPAHSAYEIRRIIRKCQT